MEKDSKQPEATADQKGPEVVRTSPTGNLLYRWVIFPVMTAFLIVLSLAVHVGSLKASANKGMFPVFLDFLAQLFRWVVYQEYLTFTKSKVLRPDKIRSKWYVPLFLARSAAMAFLIKTGISTSFHHVLYPLVVLQLSYFLMILCLRPYSSTFFTF